MGALVPKEGELFSTSPEATQVKAERAEAAETKAKLATSVLTLVGGLAAAVMTGPKLVAALSVVIAAAVGTSVLAVREHSSVRKLRAQIETRKAQQRPDTGKDDLELCPR